MARNWEGGGRHRTMRYTVHCLTPERLRLAVVHCELQLGILQYSDAIDRAQKVRGKSWWVSWRKNDCRLRGMTKNRVLDRYYWVSSCSTPIHFPIECDLLCHTKQVALQQCTDSYRYKYIMSKICSDKTAIINSWPAARLQIYLIALKKEQKLLSKEDRR